MKSLVLVGHDLDILDLARSVEGCVLRGYVDVREVVVEAVETGVAFLGGDDERSALEERWEDVGFVLTVDQPTVRQRLFELYGASRMQTLVSPLAHVSEFAELGAGVVLQHRVTVMPGAKIGEGALLNVGATVHHESRIGRCAVLAPGSIILGRSVVEDGAYVGAGAIVNPGCRVGEGALVASGAVVVGDVEAGALVAGVPAKPKSP